MGQRSTTIATYVLLTAVSSAVILAPVDIRGSSAAPLPVATLRISGTVRDFHRNHPDFAEVQTEGNGHVAGNVERELGPAGRPTALVSVIKATSPTVDRVSGWSFDEGAGPTASDVTGTHHGTLTNGPTWMTGKYGGSIRFDGVDDFIEVPHDPVFLLDEVTVTYWFKSDDPGPRQGVISKDSTSFDDGGHFTCFVWDSRVQIRLQSTTASYWVRSPVDSIQPDTWYHVAFSFGPTGMHFYLDGKAVDSDPYTGGMGTTSGGSGNEEPWTFGVNSWLSDDHSSNGWIEPFRGELDELQIYQIELTETHFESVGGYKVPAEWLDADGNAIAPHLFGSGAGAGTGPVGPCFTVADTAGSAGVLSPAAISSHESFDDWFRDVMGTNMSNRHVIVLTETAGVYEYLTDDFYPIDDDLLGNQGEAHNNNFTYTFRTTLPYEACAGQFIEFEGGDGAWLFVGDDLVMDLGGMQSGVAQHVDMDRLGLTDGETYDVRLFYAHRQLGSAVFRLRTNVDLGYVPGSVSVSAGYD